MDYKIIPGTAYTLSESEQAIEIVDGLPYRRSLLTGDEIFVTQIQITGWNTRIDFQVTKTHREYVPPSQILSWTKEGGSYFLDFRNHSWGKAPLQEIYYILQGT